MGLTRDNTLPTLRESVIVLSSTTLPFSASRVIDLSLGASSDLTWICGESIFNSLHTTQHLNSLHALREAFFPLRTIIAAHLTK